MSDVPIISTEGGWGVDYNISPDEKPAAIARWYILLASAGANGSAGVQAACWYGWNVDKDGTLYGDAGNPSAIAAYTATYKWLVGATFSQRCAGQGDAGLVVCDLALASGVPAQILWDTDGQATFTPTFGTVLSLLDGGTEASLALSAWAWTPS